MGPMSTSRSPATRFIGPACGTAALVAAIGVSLSLIVCVSAWAIAPHSPDSSFESPVRLAAGMWLLAHHVALDLPTGSMSLVPLGLMLVPALLLYAGGRQLARRTRPTDLRDVLRTVVPYALTYGVVAAVLAGAARSPELRPHALAAFVGAATVGFLFGSLGLMSVGGLLRRTWGGAPQVLRRLITAATAGLASLVAFASLAVALTLAMGFPESVDMFGSLDADPAGGVVVALLSVAFVPNLIVWAISFSTGVGFALGTASTVSPRGIEYGALPVFPPLSSVPPEGEPGAVALLVLVAPVLAGAVTGLVAHRRLRALPRERVALVAGGSGLLVGAAVAALAWLSGGSLAGGQLSTVGPSWWRVGLVTGLEVALVAAAVAWEAHRRSWDGRRVIQLRDGVGRVLSRGARTGSRPGVGFRH